MEIGMDGMVRARLRIPEELDHPALDADVEFNETNEGAEVEVHFEVRWFGIRGSPDYTAYVQETIENLLDRTIELCESE
jgi:hypothetical protein